MATTTTKKYVSLEKLGLYDEKIKKVITDGDAATLDSAKSYADGLATNYDAAGSAATVQGNLDAEIARAKAAEEANAAAAKNAQDEVDALELVVETKAAQSDLDALEALVGTLPEGTTAKDVVDYVNIKTSGIATDVALGELQNQLSGVQGEVNTIKGDYLKAADKTELEGKITSAQNAADAAQGDIDAFEEAYAVDKKDLEDAIALKADQTALDEVSGVANAAATKTALQEEVNRATGEEARIEGLVTAEADRAKGIEADLEERLVEVETFFKTAEGETIDQAMDTLVEIQKYITEDGSAADQMVKDIAANKKAIEDHVATNHDFAGADAALKDELTTEINKKADATVVEGIDGRVTIVEGKVSTLEGEMDAVEGRLDVVEGAVATKVEQSAYNEKIAALEGVDSGLDTRLQAIEAKFTGDGDGSVADQIADAKQAAIDSAAADATEKANKAFEDAKKYADEEDAKIESRVDALETASATHALASDLTTLAGRVETAEGEIDTLQTEMDAVEALAASNKTAHEANAAAIALKASQADLEAAVARIDANEAAIASFVEVTAEEIDALFA